MQIEDRLKLKTKFMNRHFINELEKIGLQLIHITGTYMGRLNVLLEAKDASIGGQVNT